MSKVKILHIIKSLGRGGAEVLLPETLKLHNRTKFEFHYIYFLPWKDQMVEPLRAAGGEVFCIKASNNLEILGKSSQVVEYCQRNKIDLIHCHLPWSGFLGRIVKLRLNIPVLYTEHNIQEHYHPATKILNRLSFNYQTLALGVSADATQSILRNIEPKIPVQTVLNGVNTEHFSKDLHKRRNIRGKHLIPESACVIGNIAVFREQKAIPVWLDAFNKVIEKHPDIYGLLVGAGPKENEIKKIVEDFGLKGRLIMPGLQTETVDYFSAIDIFMMSSSFEGLPIALLEAMSMECAIVSTKAGGVVEVVKDANTGYLCEVGDSSCLASKVSRLIQNKDERHAFQVAAREQVVKNFSLTRMVNDLENIYIKYKR